MASSNALLQFLSMMVGQSPMLIVYVAGIVFALTKWRRYPRPALLVVLGLSTHLAANVGFAAVQVYVLTMVAPGGVASLARTFMIMSITGALLHAFATVLLICAAFAARRSTDVGFPVGVPMATYPAAPDATFPPPLRS